MRGDAALGYGSSMRWHGAADSRRCLGKGAKLSQEAKHSDWRMYRARRIVCGCDLFDSHVD